MLKLWIKNENCFWDALSECMNVFECYYLEKSSNCRYVQDSQRCRDCMDMSGWGWSWVELVYESASVWDGAYNIIFSNTIWDGQKNSLYIGLLLYSIGFFLFAIATESWMMFVFLIPYCLGGIAGPAIQGIISTQVPPNSQGELQGAPTSLMSATSIIGPLLMTQLFSAFTGESAPYYFPGAPMAMGGVLTLLSLLFARRALVGFGGVKSQVHQSK